LGLFLARDSNWRFWRKLRDLDLETVRPRGTLINESPTPV
jgi:hypothetical protein